MKLAGYRRPSDSRAFVRGMTCACCHAGSARMRGNRFSSWQSTALENCRPASRWARSRRACPADPASGSSSTKLGVRRGRGRPCHPPVDQSHEHLFSEEQKPGSVVKAWATLRSPKKARGFIPRVNHGGFRPRLSVKGQGPACGVETIECPLRHMGHPCVRLQSHLKLSHHPPAIPSGSFQKTDIFSPICYAKYNHMAFLVLYVLNE